LPPGQYQAEFYLSNFIDNWSSVRQADSFAIDGDLLRDSTHYYADQPVLDIAAPIPLNFNLTLTGSPGSSDYFLLAMKMPDGGMLAGPDGSEWLAWAAMDQDSPTLNLDLPSTVQVTSAEVPEPLPALLMLLGIGAFLLRRPRRLFC